LRHQTTSFPVYAQFNGKRTQVQLRCASVSQRSILLLRDVNLRPDGNGIGVCRHRLRSVAGDFLFSEQP
jgi:hypothetical protein